jgi:hypothetical protein
MEAPVLGMIAVALFFCGAALTATWFARGTRLGYVGAALVGNNIASTGAAFVGFSMAHRTILETALIVPIVWTALWAWMGQTSARAPRIVICLSLLTACAITAAGLTGSSTKAGLNTLEAVINVIFILQCVCTGAPGAKREYDRWIDRIERNHNLDRPHYADAWLLRQLDQEPGRGDRR